MSSALMGSACSRPYLSHSSFSLWTISGSTLVPMRKLSDSMPSIASTAASANLSSSSNTFSQRGQNSAAGASMPSSARASRMSSPLLTLVVPVPIFPNMRPRQWSHSPISARALALSRFS